MPSPNFAGFPDPLLTQDAVAIIQSDTVLVAPKVARNVPSLFQGGQFPRYKPADWARLETRKRGPGSRAARGGFELDTVPFFIDVWAVEMPVDQQRRAVAASRGINLDLKANRWVTHQMLLRKEQNFFDNVFGTGIWTTSWTGNSSASSYAAGTAGTVKKWNQSGSTPVEDVDYLKQFVAQITGIEPNVGVIGRGTWTALRSNAEFLARVQYGGTTQAPAVIDEPALAAILGLDAIYVVRGVKNTAAEQDTPAFQFFAPNGFMLAYVPDQADAGEEQPASVYSLNWDGYDMGNGEGVTIFEYPEPQTRSMVVSGEIYTKPFIPAPDLGAFIDQVV